MKKIILLTVFAIINPLFAAEGPVHQIAFVFPDGQNLSVSKGLFLEHLGYFQLLENFNQDISELFLVEDMIGKLPWAQSISVAHFLLLKDLIKYADSASLRDFFNAIADFNDLMKVYVLADFFMLTDPSADFKRLEIMQEVLKQRCKALTEQEFMQVNIPLLAFIMDLGFLDKNDVLKFVWAGDKVDRISFSPDGVYVTIQYYDGGRYRFVIKRLDDLNGASVLIDDQISYVSFSPDSLYVLIEYCYGYKYRFVIKRLDDLNGAPVWVGERVSEVSFSPDGAYVAIRYYLVDYSDRYEIKRLNDLNGAPVWTGDHVVRNVLFSQDGAYVALRYIDNRCEIKRLDNLNGAPVWAGDQVGSISFSSDGAYVALIYMNMNNLCEIKRLNDLNGAPVWAGDNVRSISFSPDKVYVTIQYDDRAMYRSVIKRLDDLNGAPVWRGDNVRSISFSPDGAYVAIQYFNSSCEIKRLNDLNGPPVWFGNNVLHGVFSPDGVYVAIIYSNRRAEIERLIPLFKNEDLHFDLLMFYKLQIAKTIEDLTDGDKEYFLSLPKDIQQELIKRNSLLNDLIAHYKSRLEKMRVVLFEPVEQEKSLEQKMKEASEPETTTPVYRPPVAASATASGVSVETTTSAAGISAPRKATATAPKSESSMEMDKVD